jgi:hypothetical protein
MYKIHFKTKSQGLTMQALIYLLSFFLLSLGTVHANDHGGIHIHVPNCEDLEDDDEPKPAVCMEIKPWYHHQHYDEYEDIQDQADRLQDDTSWPGQRVDFSDLLNR